MNKVFLIGRLGQDAELRRTQDGGAVANLNLATSERWTNKAGEKQESTQWHRVVVWGKMAEVLTQYLTKGRQISVEGKINYNKWKDASGVEKWSTDIHASNIELLGSVKQETAPAPTSNPNTVNNDSFTGEDIPF